MLSYEQQFWPKYLGTIEKLHDFILNHHNNYYPPFPPLPPINVEKLTENTSFSFVNTLCNIEMGKWGGGGGGELKVRFQFSLPKLICSNICGQDLGVH